MLKPPGSPWNAEESQESASWQGLQGLQGPRVETDRMNKKKSMKKFIEIVENFVNCAFRLSNF